MKLVMLWAILVWNQESHTWETSLEVERVQECMTSGEILVVREQLREMGHRLHAVECRQWHEEG